MALYDKIYAKLKPFAYCIQQTIGKKGEVNGGP